MKSLLSVLLLAVVLTPVLCAPPFSPLFKVFCQGAPLFRGRIDSLVEPGTISQHSHRVCGGNNFFPGAKNQDPVDYYKKLFASSCTTGSIQKVDNSAYWHPDLYYRWPNGTFQLVPEGGLTVYYLFRSGNANINQSNPAWKAFPAGFRMSSGDFTRRSYNASMMSNRAVSYACLSEPGGPETPQFPTDTRFCKNGLRMQVHFPQCWNGKDLDSPNHQDHVSFPIQMPDNGDCPAAFPVRLPNLFFEAFYSVDKFPHGTGTQPFVLSTGDTTGYGFHGDFVSGWDPNVMQSAILDPSCGDKNTNEGNTVENCKPLAPFVHRMGLGECQLANPIPLTEDLAVGHTITRLPGCNPPTAGPGKATPCFADPDASYSSPVRFHLKSKKTGKFLTCPQTYSIPMTANSTVTTLQEVFTTTAVGAGTWFQSEYSLQFWSATGPNGEVMCDRGAASDWETFKIVPQTGDYVAITSNKNGNYLSVQGDSTINPTAKTLGDNELFEKIAPNGGAIY